MKTMGVERSVTRWYALRQLLAEEIVRLEATLAQPPDANQDTQGASAQETVDLLSLQEQLTNAQEKLRLLGSCPQPMMG